VVGALTGYCCESLKAPARYTFDEAERASAALLLDEADALFAERTEVRNEHDRYANLKVNFLQRVETISPVWWRSRSGSAILQRPGLSQSENPVSAKVPLPLLVVTPFSKKQPPPNDKPI